MDAELYSGIFQRGANFWRKNYSSRTPRKVLASPLYPLANKKNVQITKNDNEIIIVFYLLI